MTAAAPASQDDNTAARLRALLVRAPTALAFVSGQRFEVVSEEFNHLFGFGDDADLSGQSTRVVHTTDLAHAGLNERAAAAFAAGQPLDEEIEYVKRDCHRFWGRLQATPVHWEAPQRGAVDRRGRDRRPRAAPAADLDGQA